MPCSIDSISPSHNMKEAVSVLFIIDISCFIWHLSSVSESLKYRVLQML